jgi:membrane protein implicated in regulation of membrane protease activity
MEPYVAWLVLGSTLVIIEMTTGTFYLLMLGMACFGAGATAFIGQPFPVQILIATLVSVAGAWFVHTYRRTNAERRMISIDAGMPAKFEHWTDQPTGRARVRYRDASWDARLETGVDLQPGATLYVRTVDGNTLHVGTQPPD